MAKTTTIFNKNHISITKLSGIKEGEYSVHIVLNSGNIHGENKPRYTTEKVKRVSPLGFYYYETIYNPTDHLANSSSVKVIYVTLNDVKYVISYLYRYGESKIDNDLRPYEIHPNDKPLEEHFIYALKDCIDGIIDEVIGCKNKILYRGTEKITQANIEAFRSELYTDLFGHKRGIRFQTDSEKIMAHGFDIKTSFRNVK